MNIFLFHQCILTSFRFEAGLGADCAALCQKAPRQVLGGLVGVESLRIGSLVSTVPCEKMA